MGADNSKRTSRSSGEKVTAATSPARPYPPSHPPANLSSHSGSSQPITLSRVSRLSSTVAAVNQSHLTSSHGTPLSPSGRIISSPVATYIDHRSMVYTAFPPTDESAVGPLPQTPSSVYNRSLGGGGTAFTISLPVAVSPLTPECGGNPPTAGRRSLVDTTPIVIPTYNAQTEGPSSVSPMLRSYRQHSFPQCSQGPSSGLLGGSPRSPAIPFTGANAAVSHSNTPLSVSTPSTSLLLSDVGPPALTRMTSASSGAATDSKSAPIHTRFLEITGYPLGLENYGNTCYCNSIIQLLYHCSPLRLRLLELQDIYVSKKGGTGFEENTVLFHLCSLISVMHKSNNRRKERRELIAPKALLACVRERNAVFNNNMQQDAHEFAMFILNDIMETEAKMMTDAKNLTLFLEESQRRKSTGLSFWKAVASSSSSKKTGTAIATTGPAASGTSSGKDGATHPGCGEKSSTAQLQPAIMSPLQSILQGLFGSLTACLECGSITARDEPFIDLSLETRQGSSLLNCLHHFGDPEYFYGSNKLRCERCQAPVRAAKTIHIQCLPQYALLVHLKRFQYDAQKQTFTKKADHVALPIQMDVEEYLTEPNEDGETADAHAKESCDSASAPPGGPGSSTQTDAFKPVPEHLRTKLLGAAKHKARYTLTGFVVHIGEGPNLGHYFTCVRYGPQLWRRFDDDVVSVLTEREVQQYFGVPMDASGMITTTAYILLYERAA